MNPAVGQRWVLKGDGSPWRAPTVATVYAVAAGWVRYTFHGNTDVKWDAPVDYFRFAFAPESNETHGGADKSLSSEDRAFLVVARWFDKHDAGYGKWWNRIKLWNRRDELTAAIAEEIRKGAS